MQTVVIYDAVECSPIQFFIYDVDLSHLDGVYVNGGDLFSDRTAQEAELSEILASATLLERFPVQAVKDGALVIVAGFLP